MAESLFPLNSGCPNIQSKKCSVKNGVCYSEFDQKRLKVLRCSGRTEYDTHQKVISKRSRVGNRLRPEACMHALHGCKRVILGFSRGLY